MLERDLAYLEERRADLDEISGLIAASPDGSAFAPVVDVGQRIDTVMQAWLREQIAIARAG